MRRSEVDRRTRCQTRSASERTWPCALRSPGLPPWASLVECRTGRRIRRTSALTDLSESFARERRASWSWRVTYTLRTTPSRDIAIPPGVGFRWGASAGPEGTAIAREMRPIPDAGGARGQASEMTPRFLHQKCLSAIRSQKSCEYKGHPAPRARSTAGSGLNDLAVLGRTFATSCLRRLGCGDLGRGGRPEPFGPFARLLHIGPSAPIGRARAARAQRNLPLALLCAALVCNLSGAKNGIQQGLQILLTGPNSSERYGPAPPLSMIFSLRLYPDVADVFFALGLMRRSSHGVDTDTSCLSCSISASRRSIV